MKRSSDFDANQNNPDQNQNKTDSADKRLKMTWSGLFTDPLGTLSEYFFGTQPENQNANRHSDAVSNNHQTVEHASHFITAEKDANGRTALHRSAKAGEAETTTALLAQGYKPTDADANEMIPLHFSAQIGCPEVTRILLQVKSAPDHLDIKKRTPLHLAAMNNHAADVRLLLRANADVSLLDKDGETALHRAASAGHHQIVATYIEEGKNIDIKNAKGKKAYEPLALMLALVSINAMDALKNLVNKGMNIHKLDDDNTSLLQLVVKRRPRELPSNTPDIVKGLIEHGCRSQLERQTRPNCFALCDESTRCQNIVTTSIQFIASQRSGRSATTIYGGSKPEFIGLSVFDRSRCGSDACD